MMQQQEQRDLTQSGCGQEDCGYNEIVIDAEFWKSRLPFLIEAIFYPIGQPAAEERARKIHRKFLNAFRQQEVQTPLLSVDFKNSHIPFTLQYAAT